MKIKCACGSCEESEISGGLKIEGKSVLVISLYGDAERDNSTWLDRDSAARLWPALKHFAETGEWKENETWNQKH